MKSSIRARDHCGGTRSSPRLSSQPFVNDIYAKTGRNGNLAFTVTRTDYTDQRGEFIGSHERSIAYPEHYNEQRAEHAAQPGAAREVSDPPAMLRGCPLPAGKYHAYFTIGSINSAPWFLALLTLVPTR